jgi:hypothetical protein
MVSSLQACDNFSGWNEFRKDIDPNECMMDQEGPNCPQNTPHQSSGVSWSDALDIIGAFGAIAAGVAIGMSGGESSQPTYQSYSGRGGSGSTITTR